MTLKKIFKNRIGVFTIAIILVSLAVIFLVPTSSARYAGSERFSHKVGSDDTDKPWTYALLSSASTYSVGENGLHPGKYYFSIDGKNYYFTLSNELSSGSKLTLNSNTGKVDAEATPNLSGYTVLTNDNKSEFTLVEALTANGKYCFEVNGIYYLFTATQNVSAGNKITLNTDTGLVYYPGKQVCVKTDNWAENEQFLIVFKNGTKGYQAIYENKGSTSINAIQVTPQSGSFYADTASAAKSSLEYIDFEGSPIDKSKYYLHKVDKEGSYYSLYNVGDYDSNSSYTPFSCDDGFGTGLYYSDDGSWNSWVYESGVIRTNYRTILSFMGSYKFLSLSKADSSEALTMKTTMGGGGTAVTFYNLKTVYDAAEFTQGTAQANSIELDFERYPSTETTF